LPEIFLIDSKYEEVFISDDYFVLYQKSKPYYYKKFEDNLNIDDLKVFVRNHLGMKNIRVSSLKNSVLKNQNEKFNYKFLKATRNSYFLYYILYLSILLSLLAYFYINTMNKNTKKSFSNLESNFEKIKKDKEFTYLSKEILEIYENTKSNNVTINLILFENSKFLITLESEKKDGVYKLLDSIKNSFIEDMQFNKKEKKYEAHVSFKISRN